MLVSFLLGLGDVWAFWRTNNRFNTGMDIYIYIYKHIDSTKNRIRLFLLNPVLYFFIFELIMIYLFSITEIHPGNI